MPPPLPFLPYPLSLLIALSLLRRRQSKPRAPAASAVARCSPAPLPSPPLSCCPRVSLSLTLCLRRQAIVEPSIAVTEPPPLSLLLSFSLSPSLGAIIPVHVLAPCASLPSPSISVSLLSSHPLSPSSSSFLPRLPASPSPRDAVRRHPLVFFSFLSCLSFLRCETATALSISLYRVLLRLPSSPSCLPSLLPVTDAAPLSLLCTPPPLQPSSLPLCLRRPPLSLPSSLLPRRRSRAPSAALLSHPLFSLLFPSLTLPADLLKLLRHPFFRLPLSAAVNRLRSPLLAVAATPISLSRSFSVFSLSVYPSFSLKQFPSLSPLRSLPFSSSRFLSLTSSR